MIKQDFGIDVNNPFEYYNTDDIEEIPKHLRKEAEKILKQNKK